MKNLKNKKGFTIVELVIVIAVIAILAAVLIPTFGGVIDKANKSAAMQEARNAYTQYVATAPTIEDIKYVKVGDLYFEVNNWDVSSKAPTASGKFLPVNDNGTLGTVGNYTYTAPAGEGGSTGE